MPEATEMTKRDQLQELMDGMKGDEKNAIQEAGAFFKSPEAQDFRARIDGFHKRTIPGSAFDQVLGSVLKVLDSIEPLAATLTKSVAPGATAPTEQKQTEQK